MLGVVFPCSLTPVLVFAYCAPRRPCAAGLQGRGQLDAPSMPVQASQGDFSTRAVLLSPFLSGFHRTISTNEDTIRFGNQLFPQRRHRPTTVYIACAENHVRVVHPTYPPEAVYSKRRRSNMAISRTSKHSPRSEVL